MLFFQVNIKLTETETIWILDIPDTCVALDSDEAQEVKKRNEEYKEVLYFVYLGMVSNTFTTLNILRYRGALPQRQV